ncbi:hypothetical protein EVAR_19219_1 [Eumeta japonica]|uniref:Uncharacterized protein n=1 Tax=Eumeta variegata TaxID=151549 RepID=A0A4C1VEW1_EUMVA|nr:hypothetical protein EVAR_19219_1 [Eumeta japonica]
MEIDTNPLNGPQSFVYLRSSAELKGIENWSDDSNDLNDPDDEGFTQPQKQKSRKPRLFVTYWPGFLRLCGKTEGFVFSFPSRSPRDACCLSGARYHIGKDTLIHIFLAYCREDNVQDAPAL